MYRYLHTECNVNIHGVGACVHIGKPMCGGIHLKSHQNNALVLEIRMEFSK